MYIAFVGEDDFCDVYRKLITIKAKYYELGIILGLRPGDLVAIRKGNDIDQAFTEIILMWLRQNYDVRKHGPPTWRNLVKAVDDPAGGNNHALAMSISDKHSNTGKIFTQPNKMYIYACITCQYIIHLSMNWIFV